MDPNRPESEDTILHRGLVFRVVGCAFAVSKEVGHGLHEKPHANALMLALEDAGIAVQPQAVFPIFFKTRQVGEYIPDLIADNAVIIDAKVIDRITGHERGAEVELSAHHWTASRPDHQFQAPSSKGSGSSPDSYSSEFVSLRG